MLVVVLTGACGSPGGERPGGPPPADTTSRAPSSSAGPAPVGSAGAVSAERAGQLVLEQYGGRLLNVEPDTANGVPTWEVEVADSREGRIEVDVDQASGAVVEMERD